MSYHTVYVPGLSREEQSQLVSQVKRAFDIRDPEFVSQYSGGTQRKFGWHAKEEAWQIRLDELKPENASRINFEKGVCEIMSRSSCRWPAPRMTKTGQWFAIVNLSGTEYYASCRVFEVKCRALQTNEAIAEFGRHLANLHLQSNANTFDIFRSCKLTEHDFHAEPSRQILDVAPHKRKTELYLSQLSLHIEQLRFEDNVTICHGDAHHLNALQREDRSCFLVDTEYICCGPRLYDIGTAVWNFMFSRLAYCTPIFLRSYLDESHVSLEEIRELWKWILARHLWWIGLRAAVLPFVPVPGGDIFFERQLESAFMINKKWALQYDSLCERINK